MPKIENAKKKYEIFFFFKKKFFSDFFFLEMLWKMHPDGLCVTRKCDIQKNHLFRKTWKNHQKLNARGGVRERVRLLKNSKKPKKDIKTSKNIILDGIWPYNEVKYRIIRVCMFLCHFRLGGVFFRGRI